MSIFPILELEPLVQVNDKTRLDASKSFVTQDTSFVIQDIQIDPTGSAGFFSVATEKALDWAFAASGVYQPKLRVTLGSGASAQISGSITAISVVADKLFATDEDLKLHETEITKYVRDGRATFKDIHRRAQTIIIEWLNKEGYVNNNNEPFSKADIVDIEEVRQWSVYIALRVIFDGLSNSKEDVFFAKSKYYKGQEVEWRSKALLRIDVDGDGIADDFEGIDPAFGSVFRR